MAPPPKPPVQEQDIQGLKYFKVLSPLLERLHPVGAARDRAGNRHLHFDQYGALILLYFFTPVLTSLRGIQQASTLKKVQAKTGCARTSLGALSEAARLFDPTPLKEIIAELAGRIPVLDPKAGQEALKALTVVDGSLLPALPKMAWALWLDERHRAAKMHLSFEVLRGIPLQATPTAGNDSEHEQFRVMLQSGRLYCIDRGYAEYLLFQQIIAAQSSFIGRIRANAVWRVVEERPLSPAARAAGVRRDQVVWLGCAQSGAVLKQALRVVEVHPGKVDVRGVPEVLLSATDRMDLDAELVALGYKYRWSVELFFRWFKCIPGCRHLLSTCQRGVEIQVYLALIASLLISLWTGRKPTKRTFELLCLYFSGWASEEELIAHLEKLKKQD